MKRGAYLAIGYACNEQCSFCPCSELEKKEKKLIPYNELERIIHQLALMGCPEITVSGGEPTLHPDFVELLAAIQKKEMKITVLTNGECLSDVSLQKNMDKKLDLSKIRFITTLHSHQENMHEAVNHVKGSFKRSIDGLKSIHHMGAKTEVKHCITRENYKDLASFYEFCDKEFDESITLQICSIDYCGMKEDEAENEMIAFYEMRPYLEEMFDLHLKQASNGSRRRLYCINLPLCACDVYYWSMMPGKSKVVYKEYTDPLTCKIGMAEENVDTDPDTCRGCKVIELCCGTYKTAFNRFGGKLVKPYY